MNVLSKIVAVRLFVTYMMMVLLYSGCGGALSEKGLGDEQQAISDEDFVASIKQQIDDRVTHQDAMDDIAKVRGKVVKWSGDIVIIWNEKLLIASPSREGDWDHFILVIDHPLPQDVSIEDLIQTVSIGDAIYAIGRIIDRKTIVLETGSDLTIPHLRCYVISKENDRNFSKPAWVGNK